MIPKLGDTVIFTNRFGDPHYTESVALITSINPDGTVDLVCFFRNETFYRLSAHQGGVGDRDTWRPRL